MSPPGESSTPSMPRTQKGNVLKMQPARERSAVRCQVLLTNLGLIWTCRAGMREVPADNGVPFPIVTRCTGSAAEFRDLAKALKKRGGR